jgi:hypothetical protein
VRGVLAQARRDQCVHAVRERYADVDLGEAEEAAVGTHHPLVVGEREHRAGGERVSLKRRHAGHVELEHARQQPVQARHELADQLLVGGHPLEVEPVRPDLAARRRHERARRRRRLDLIEASLDRVERVVVEAVLAAAEVEHEDLALARQAGKRLHLLVFAHSLLLSVRL